MQLCCFALILTAYTKFNLIYLKFIYMNDECIGSRPTHSSPEAMKHKTVTCYNKNCNDRTWRGTGMWKWNQIISRRAGALQRMANTSRLSACLDTRITLTFICWVPRRQYRWMLHLQLTLHRLIMYPITNVRAAYITRHITLHQEAVYVAICFPKWGSSNGFWKDNHYKRRSSGKN
jgi:hypothetical protein